MKTNTAWGWVPGAWGLVLGAWCLVLLVGVTGCDYIDNRTLDRERADSVYRDAMADYTAGRIDKAIEGLERVVRATPGNSSARFQLACLLQDSKKDYLGAFCNYREFLALDKSGDKASFARDRMTQCERLLAEALAKKYDIGGNASLLEEKAELQKQLAEAVKTNAALTKDLDKATAKAASAAAETERMRRMLIGEVAEDAKKPVLADAKALLDDDEEVSGKDRIKLSQDAKNLIIEEEKEELSTPFETVEKKETPKTEKKNEEPLHEPRPAEYVVQDGDTLYRIATRFYGRRSAWTLIREANKAEVSTDGRIKTGQKLVLPNP